MGMMHRAPHKHIFCLTYTLGPWGVLKRSNFYSEVVMLHIYQIKGNWGIEQHVSTHSVLTHTLGPWDGVKRSKQFLEVVKLHIKFKGMSIKHHASTYSVLKHP